MVMGDNMPIEAKNKSLLSSGRFPGFLIMAASVVFFLFTITGKWSSGAGIGARLFPQGSILIMFVSGAAIFFRKSGEEKQSKYRDIQTFHIVFFLGLAFLYVLAVIKIGLGVGTFLYFLVSFFYFQRWEAPARTVLLPSVIVTVFIWGLFTFFAQIVLPQVLLF